MPLRRQDGHRSRGSAPVLPYPVPVVAWAAGFETGCETRGIACVRLGEVTADGALRLSIEGDLRIHSSLADLRKAWESTLPALFPAGADAKGCGA